MDRIIKSKYIFLVGIIFLSPGLLIADNLKISRDKRTGETLSITNRDVSLVSSSSTFKNARSFKTSAAKNPIAKSDEFISKVKDQFGITGAVSLKTKNTNTDDFGVTTVRYEQFYKGVKVEGADLIATLNRNYEVINVKGRTLKNIRLDATPKINARKALDVAQKRVRKSAAYKAKKIEFLKQVRRGCKSLLNESGSPTYSSCFIKERKRFNKLSKLKVDGKISLVIYNEGFLNNSRETESKLIYKYIAANPETGDSANFLINAHNASIYKITDTRMHVINRNIYDCSDPLNTDTCYLDRFIGSRGYTFGRSENAPVRGPVPFGFGMVTEGSTDTDKAHALIPHMHDFYMNKFGRDGGNSKGGLGGTGSSPYSETRVYVNLNGNPIHNCNPGAAWFSFSPTSVGFCKDSMTNDVLAHEYTHAVSYYLSFNQDGSFISLIGDGESGSLNESFSDIIGESFERQMSGSNDWIFGANSNVFENGNEEPRVLFNPSQSQYKVNGITASHPSRFNDPNFYCGTEDKSGVHLNSTVPSHAAYLASEGGAFNGCTITGIGLDKVEQIWYRAHTRYSANENFNMAFSTITQVCSEMVEISSTNPGSFPVDITQADCDNVTKALQAVEMDQAGFCSGPAAEDPEIPDCAGSCILSPFANI